jgi:hypothetical protein
VKALQSVTFGAFFFSFLISFGFVDGSGLIFSSACFCCFVVSALTMVDSSGFAFAFATPDACLNDFSIG